MSTRRNDIETWPREDLPRDSNNRPWAVDQKSQANRVLALIWGLLAAGTAVAGAVFLAVGIVNHNIGGGLVLLALSLIPALPSGRFAYGCVDAGLLVTENAVVLRNPLKKREVAVPDVARFIAGHQPALYGNPTPGIIMELKDGRSYSVWTLAHEGFVWNSARNVAAWVATAEALNELVGATS